MKHPAALTVFLATTLVASACQRDIAPATPTPDTEATASELPADTARDPLPSASPPTFMPGDEPKPEGSFSAAALAGLFEGEGRLSLSPDGTYNFSLGDASDVGTWGPDGGDPKRLRFDPDSKSLQDHVLEVVSNDELKPTAANGSGMASGVSFKRIATP